MFQQLQHWFVDGPLELGCNLLLFVVAVGERILVQVKGMLAVEEDTVDTPLGVDSRLSGEAEGTLVEDHEQEELYGACTEDIKSCF